MPVAPASRPRLVRALEPPRRAPPSWSDVLLLAFLIALHSPPLVALAAGRSWGAGAEGYATVVVLLAGVELGRELRDHARRGGALEARCP